MAKRYDVMTPRPGREEGKTFWHRVGTAFEREKDDGSRSIGVIFDSLPLPDREGKVSVQLFEPREKSQGAGTAGGDYETAPAARRTPGSRNTSIDPDDSIPF